MCLAGSRMRSQTNELVSIVHSGWYVTFTPEPFDQGHLMVIISYPLYFASCRPGHLAVSKHKIQVHSRKVQPRQLTAHVHTSNILNQLFSELMLPAERDGQPYPEPVLAGHVPTQEQGLPVLVEGPEVSTTSNDKLLDGRIGKVAISPGHEGLQVDGSNISSGGMSPDDQVGKAPMLVSKTEKEFASPLSPPAKPRPRKKLIFLVIALILVITAAVVGGVLGSRTVSGSTSTSPTPLQTLQTLQVLVPIHPLISSNDPVYQ